MDRSTVLAHEPLRMSLADLRSADMKGKWWVVGAAWAGNPLVDQQTERQKLQAPKVADVTTENVLLKLAKKQGMNTDIRRSIFVVLMSSEVCEVVVTL
jgi:nucleolar MIF4G domain-containing protein 1